MKMANEYDMSLSKFIEYVIEKSLEEKGSRMTQQSDLENESENS